MEQRAKIYVAGHRGLVGSAILRALEKEGYEQILTNTRDELDLVNQKAVAAFFETEKPEYVFLAAAKVGGIMANKEHPADFMYQNLQIQNNVIESAYRNNTTKLIFLGSSCIYPKEAPQPIPESALLTGPLEETNRSYAIAKIAGIELCRAHYVQHGSQFISVMPTNLYGPRDNFDLETSHVLPALIRKFHEAKEAGDVSVTLWGTGSPRREFLHVDDLAQACLFLMKEYGGSTPINIGTGTDISIKDLAELIKKIVGYDGEVRWDSSKPDGTPRKLLDVSTLRDLGWKHSISLEEGIRSTYQWFLSHKNDVRGLRTKY